MLNSPAARRARVSRLPRPQSTRSRVRCVSSRVMLPELPDASMETRKPIALPSIALQNITQTNFQNDGTSIPARQREKKDYNTRSMTVAGKSRSLHERVSTNGFAIVPNVLSERESADLQGILDRSKLPRSRAGMRHAMRNTSVAAL